MFPTILPGEKATTKFECISNVEYPQGCFVSNTVDVLGAMELEKKNISSVYTQDILHLVYQPLGMKCLMPLT